MVESVVTDALCIASEDETYRATWKKWESKITTMLKQWEIPGVVGCTFDDLFSLAQQVMLYTIRSYDSELAKFSTYFYNNLKNAIKTEYGKSGLARYCYQIQITDKRTSEVTVLSKTFTSFEEARNLSDSIGRGRRRTRILFFRQNRHKRIPPTDMTPFDTAANEQDDENLVNKPEYRLGVKDRSSQAYLFRTVSRNVTDRSLRKILFRLYVGDSPAEAARRLKKTQDEVDAKLQSFRKQALQVMKDLR